MAPRPGIEAAGSGKIGRAVRARRLVRFGLPAGSVIESMGRGGRDVG